MIWFRSKIREFNNEFRICLLKIYCGWMVLKKYRFDI